MGHAASVAKSTPSPTCFSPKMSDANDVLKRLLGMLNEATTASSSSSSTSGGPPAKKPKYSAEERREHAKKLQREVAENAAKNVAAEVRQELQTLKEAIRMLAKKTEELSDTVKALQRDRDDDANNDDDTENHD